MTGLSARYTFVPTTDIVAGLSEKHWLPVAVEHLGRPGEGPLGIDDPRLAAGLAHQGLERGRARSGKQFAVEAELAAAVAPPQPGQVPALEHPGERPDRKEEAGVRWHPAPPGWIP